MSEAYSALPSTPLLWQLILLHVSWMGRHISLAGDQGVSASEKIGHADLGQVRTTQKIQYGICVSLRFCCCKENTVRCRIFCSCTRTASIPARIEPGWRDFSDAHCCWLDSKLLGYAANALRHSSRACIPTAVPHVEFQGKLQSGSG